MASTVIKASLNCNTIDTTGSIQFTYEEEVNGAMPFLDTLMKNEQDGSITFTVYRKPTHTDQYLHFKSHHPLHQKLGVVRPLLDRCKTVVTKDEDKIAEVQHIEKSTWCMWVPSIVHQEGQRPDECH